MKLDLGTFLASGERLYHFSGMLEKNESKYDIDNLNLIFPVKYQGSICNLQTELVLGMDIFYSYDTECDRCLKPFRRDVTSHVEAYHYRTQEKPEDDALSDTFAMKEEEIELDDLIISQLITSRPTKNLCSEDCKGLCPICGHDLNDGPCSCDGEVVEEEQVPDPRFAKLMDLFNDEEV